MLGPQWPPFSLVPESFTTAAARELADFATTIGQPGDEWQRNTLEIGCGELRDGTWAANEVALLTQRQNGKGWFPETRGLGGLYLLGERHLIYTAHNIDTAKNTFGRCVDLVDNYDDLRRRTKRINRVNGEEAIEHVSGAVFQFRTRGAAPARRTRPDGAAAKRGGKGRGFSCDVLFLDEALYLTQDFLDALLPTMLARPNPQVWYLSTPPTVADAPLMRIRDDGLAGVDGMAMAGWWNPPNADLSDPAVLARANPAWGIRLNMAVMATLRRRLGEEGFGRECGGIWPEPEGAQWQVIPKQDWLDALDERSQIVGPLVLVVTAQRPDRSWVAITAAGRNQYGKRHAEITGDSDRYVYDYRPGTRWVRPRLVELVDRHQPLAVVVDDRQLADEAEEAGLTVYRPTAGDMVSACGAFYAAVSDPDRERRDFIHIGQKELTDAAAGAAKRTVGQGMWAWEQRSVLVDICPLTGASLGLWALSTPRIHVRRRVASVAVVGGTKPGPNRAPVESVEGVRLREQIERDLALARRG